MKGDLLVGLEIEMGYNKNLIGYIESDSYHGSRHQRFSDRFCAESDASISSRKWRYAVELISDPVSINDFDGLLQELQDEVYRRVANNLNITESKARETYAMKDLIEFNKTMGSHIHLVS